MAGADDGVAADFIGALVEDKVAAMAAQRIR
jgi:hypothetical protein